jgi:predicted DCC family thiol-disulfide oxidoreductase YuxK
MQQSIALYDGQCPFCTREARRLERRVGGRVRSMDLHTPGLLAQHGIEREAAMEALHLVEPDGRVYRGAEAVARAVVKLPVAGLVGWLYYLPGLRWLVDRSYRRIAAARYRLWGKTQPEGCDSGACELHFGPPKS